MKRKTIYLDSHATTPVDQDVLSEMLPFFTENYGNGNHKAGWKTNQAMENARFQVANLIGAKPPEITFTSGSTEAINIALLGLAKANTGYRNHIITQKTEHQAVLQCFEELENNDYKISILDVDAVGRIRLNELKQEISDKTLVVAIMLANNEIGTVQPVKEIGEICKNAGAKFLCDITQGIGWYPVDVYKLNIDLATLSAHKFYGPRGVGALFVRKSNPKTPIKPIQFGGGQEHALRPGTSNIPGIVGLGKACELMHLHAVEVFSHIKKMRDSLQEQLFSSIEGIQLNGCPNNRHPGNLNISIPSIAGERLKGILHHVIFSIGSACSSGSAKPSHVLSAISTDKTVLSNSFRLGVSKYNTRSEIDFVAKRIIELSSQK